MMKTLTIAALALIALPTTHAHAESGKKLKVVTTLSVLASVVREIGGNDVTVKSLASPKRDPHTLVAKPTFKQAARQAQLFVELGLGLDGWASDVTSASGNPGIQTGQDGRVVASKGIRTKELPETLSKAWGDIHPYGNPHVWLDPLNMKQIATNIHEGLVRVDPTRAADYDKRLKKFNQQIDKAVYGDWLVTEYGASKLNRLSERGRLASYLKRKGTSDKLGGWLQKAAPLRGTKIVTYHKTWIYFCDRFGLDVVAEIEEKPGIPPSQTYMNKLIDKIKAENVRILFVDTFYPAKDGDFIAKKSGAKVVASPIDVGATKGTDDYFKLIDTLLDRIVAAHK
jgi:ABC-type Zn uptake system ZnuABC Zn-binding protein ZnuA